MALILAAGAVVRLLLWLWFQGEPLYVWDEQDYDLLATNLVEQGEFAFQPGVPTSLRPPLYPAMVAGVYQIFGVGNYEAVRLIQAGLSLITVLLLYRLGAAVANRSVGLAAAGFYSFYPSMLGTANLLLTETLFTLLLSATCYLVVLFYQRDSLPYLGAAGVALGLAALTRSVVWMAPPFLALFILVTWRANWSRRLLAALILVGTFALTLAPWSIRNSRLQETFVTVDVMGGRNFMMGNYEHTPFYRSWDAIALTGEQSWFHVLSAKYPQEMRATQGQLDKLALKEGLKFIAENPWLTLQRDLIKFFDFWGLERELVAGASRGWWGGLPTPIILFLAALLFGSYAAVMILGIFGMFLAPLSDCRLHWFFVLVIAYVCGMHSLVFAHSRYHLPIMPLVMVFAAHGLLNFKAMWQQRKSWRFALAALACCFLAIGWTWGLLQGDLQKLLTIFG